MSLHNFNSNTKSWKMYTNTLTSISGDDLLVMPSYGKDLILEVSANNDIFFKKGEITKRFDNLVSDYLDMSFVREASFNSLNSQIQYIKQEISGISVQNFITSGISSDLLIKPYDGRDIILEVSGNNEIIFKRGDISYNLDDLIGGGGGGGETGTSSSGYIENNNDYVSFNILDVRGKIVFTDNSNIELYDDVSFNNVDVSGALNVAGSISASSFIGDGSLLTGIQEITLLNYRDASFSNIEVSGNIQTTHIKSLASQDLLLEVSGNNEIIFKRGDFSYNLDDLIGGGSQSSDYATYNILDITGKIIFTDNSNTSGTSGSGSSNIVLTSISGDIIPFINNTFKLGDISKNWSNAYINDISVTNIDVSGALNVTGTVSASNIYTKTEVDMSFVSKQLFDASLSSIQLTNVYTKTEVDVSFVSKELFDASYNVLQTTIINNGSSGSVSITPKKFYNNNWNLLGNNITTIKDISGMSPYIMGSSADGYTIFVRWNTSTEYTSAPNQTQRRVSLGVYKFISNSWTQIGSTFLFPFPDIPAWRYAENGNGDAVGTVDNINDIRTEYMNSAGNRIAFTVSMPKFGPNQGDYLPNENTTYIYDFNGTDWVSVGTPRVTNVTVLAIGFSFENSITKMFVLNTHTNITIFTHNGTSFVEDAAQISQQTITNNIGYGYTAHFISTNGKVICIITNNKIILFKFNETSWEQYGNVITIPQWPTNDRTFVAGSYDGSIFMSIWRGQTVNGDINAGMIKIFKHNSVTNTWIQIGQDIVYEEVTYIDEAHGLQLGSDAKCISGDGTVITVGTRNYPDRYIQHVGPYLNGYVQAYKYSSVNNYWSKIGNDITGQNNERPGQVARLNYNGSVLILDGQTYRDTYSSIDSGRVRVFEIDISASGGGGGGGSSTDLTSVTSNIIPYITNTYNLGSTTSYWSNAYINNLKVSNRVYQEISGDIGWSAVNGHYGLAKDAYPALNPLSSGDKAVQTWTQRVTDFSSRSVCWSPELGLFAAVGYGGVTTSPNGITWTSISLVDSIDLHCVCWSPEIRLFVAVSNSLTNKVITSPDGTTWTAIITASETIIWRSVCWSRELGIFVAVAESGANRVMTSPNGTTWTRTLSANETSEWRSVCWSPELGLFVAVAPNGTNKVMTSSNGIDWTSRTQASEGVWCSVCWSGKLGLFVAIAEGSNEVMTSSDGKNWTLITAISSDGWYSVCWSEELTLFVAVSLYGTYKVMTSPNGINWTARTSANGTNNWTNVCWSKELGIFVAVAEGGTNTVMTSSLKGMPPTSYNVFDSSFNSIDENGNWTFTQITMKNAYIVDLSVNTINGQAYSAGGGGGSSTELTSITSNVVPATTNTYNLGSTTSYWSNAYINNLKVSNRVYQEISGDISWSSVNGHYGLAKDAYPSLNPVSSGVKAFQTWTLRQETESMHNVWNSVCWSPQLMLFVAVGGNSETIIMTSSNGINWTPRTAPEAEQSWTSVCWSPQLMLFVAVGYAGINRAMSSPDGINWTGRGGAVLNNQELLSVCWSPELAIFIAVSNGGDVISSSNGADWIVQTVPQQNERTSICWSPELGLFVSVGLGSNILISNNGVNWTSIVAPQASYWKCVCWSSQIGLFVAVSEDGISRIMTSSNGINWTLRIVPQDTDFQHVAWCAELAIFIAIAIGSPYRVLTSPDGINWSLTANADEGGWKSFSWSPELGIAVVVGMFDAVMTSSLKGRPPTSYNVFDSSFNSIDENGNWTFTQITMNNANIVDLNVTGTFTNTSDDRLKHNEVVISNGLAIIDSLTPKFYQKTLTMLDASYNGDLSTQAWTYEAGVIAQELLQISDLSFVVSGGDYYQERYIYSRPTNDPSNANYDPSFNIYDISNANYTISNNLITQAYSVNYNSVFVYGLAAIKELHQKVKAQEASISSLQTAMLEQQATINSLLTRLQALEAGAN